MQHVLVETEVLVGADSLDATASGSYHASHHYVYSRSIGLLFVALPCTVCDNKLVSFTIPLYPVHVRPETVVKCSNTTRCFQETSSRLF